MIDGMTIQEFKAVCVQEMFDAWEFDNRMLRELGVDERLIDHSSESMVNNSDGSQMMNECGTSAKFMSNRIYDICHKKNEPTEHELYKIEKARRVEKYAAMVDNDQPIEFDENEDLLYNHQRAFATSKLGRAILENENDE
jgi:hypothetical protein